MSEISFACPSCHQVLEAPPEMAGETTECPSCQQTLMIPLPEGEGAIEEIPSEEVPEAGGGEAGTALLCPSCRADMAADAVLCMRCGFHTKLGKKISTSFG